MVKYREYFEKMVSDNKALFDEFRKVHNEYSLNSDGLQEKFNETGSKVLEIVREYENRLCANTERGMYNKFSAGLAEKFQNEVRKHFPMIDHVGLIADIKQSNNPSEFFIKKINLTRH